MIQKIEALWAAFVLLVSVFAFLPGSAAESAAPDASERITYEGNGFASPEDAVLYFLDGLKNLDLEQMLDAYTWETRASRRNTEKRAAITAAPGYINKSIMKEYPCAIPKEVIIMANNVISTAKAPAAIGPYSQAIRTGNMLFTSGQLGLDPQTGSLPEGIQAQTAQALANVDAILKEAGFAKENVIKTTVFLKDLADFGVVNEIYADFFGSHKPARSCVEVARLPKDGLVEIEVVAAG